MISDPCASPRLSSLTRICCRSAFAPKHLLLSCFPSCFINACCHPTFSLYSLHAVHFSAPCSFSHQWSGALHVHIIMSCLGFKKKWPNLHFFSPLKVEQCKNNFSNMKLYMLGLIPGRTKSHLSLIYTSTCVCAHQDDLQPGKVTVSMSIKTSCRVLLKTEKKI